MAKLNKYANLYDREGNLIRHIDPNTGKLEDYTLEELEELVDKLGEDKDENGRIKDPVAFNNASMILMQYYQKYGNPHIAEMLERMKESKPKVASEKDAIESLNELAEELKEEVVKEAIEDNGESTDNIPETEKPILGNVEGVEENTEVQVDNGMDAEPAAHAENFEETVKEVIEEVDEMSKNTPTEINLDEEYVDYEEVEQ